MFQHGGESAMRSRGPRLHGADRYIQVFGDLHMGHPVKMCQPHDISLIGCKVVDRAADLEPLPRGLERRRLDDDVDSTPMTVGRSW